MCEYLKRMSPQDTPTDDIRLWSGLTHSVVEYTGPKPFGMDGSVCLWLHERSATQLLDMCDELDAKFSDLKSENAKLLELVAWMYRLMDESCAVQHMYAPEPIRYDTLLDVYEKLRELGIEVD